MLDTLIVEDESLMRQYLMLNLSSIHRDFKASGCAKDGIEAVRMLKLKHFDLVITDVKMPHMDGLELASYIHQNHKGVHVIILSGYDEFDYARLAIRYGATDYLLKPLNDSELNAVLERISNQKNNISVEENSVNEDLVKGDNTSNHLVNAAREYISKHFTEQISLSDVADKLSVNSAYLSSIFKSDKGESYSKYLLRLRMERAALLLETYNVGKISDIAEELGYISTKHFDSVFKKYYGITPLEYRERHL